MVILVKETLAKVFFSCLCWQLTMTGWGGGKGVWHWYRITQNWRNTPSKKERKRCNYLRFFCILSLLLAVFLFYGIARIHVAFCHPLPNIQLLLFLFLLAGTLPTTINFDFLLLIIPFIFSSCNVACFFPPFIKFSPFFRSPGTIETTLYQLHLWLYIETLGTWERLTCSP